LGDRITYVGLDVHRDGIVAALAEGGLRGEVRDYGRIVNTPEALQRLVRKLGHDGVKLRFCYEDGVIPARRFLVQRYSRRILRRDGAPSY
jgi:hypothetical protein